MKIGDYQAHIPIASNNSQIMATIPAGQTGRKLVVVEDPLPMDVVKGSGRSDIEHPFEKILENTDSRNMSPREAAKLGFELYAAGIFKWDEYSDFSFQAELHPEFNKTIGALTGESARPDTKRDFIKVWEDRYRFASRFKWPDLGAPERALHILSVLRRIENPTDTTA